jgi:hypothetical protein
MTLAEKQTGDDSLRHRISLRLIELMCRRLEFNGDLLKLVLAIGYLTKLLNSVSVKCFIERQESELLEHFKLVANTTSMAVSVQLVH